jgi:hypothetical protein
MLVCDRTIPNELLDKIIARMGLTLPYYSRGIKISEELVKVTIECLNNAPSNILPQNCRNATRSKTPDGLDLRIKNKMGFDLRTANIISDILAEVGIVNVIQVINPKTERNVKATKLLEEWTW